jgi:rhodanese-related sulfurtransferase
MRRLLALFAALCCAIAVPAEERHTADTLDQVKTSVAAGSAVLIDVREQEEWDSGHLQAARLVPLSVLTRDGAAIPASIPKDKPVYLHCKAGGRCLKAAAVLKAKGYDARPLEAGYGQLVKEGFEKAE